MRQYLTLFNGKLILYLNEIEPLEKSELEKVRLLEAVGVSVVKQSLRLAHSLFYSSWRGAIANIFTNAHNRSHRSGNGLIRKMFMNVSRDLSKNVIPATDHSPHRRMKDCRPHLMTHVETAPSLARAAESHPRSSKNDNASCI